MNRTEPKRMESSEMVESIEKGRRLIGFSSDNDIMVEITPHKQRGYCYISMFEIKIGVENNLKRGISVDYINMAISALGVDPNGLTFSERW